MVLRYRTAGAWGAGLGVNLTPAHVDENFYTIVLQILAAIDEIEAPVGIANVTSDGSQITVVLTDATELGPFTLPRPVQRPTTTFEVTATTYDIGVIDSMRLLRCTNAAGCILTVPSDAEAPTIPVDFEVSIWHDGEESTAGFPTVTVDAGTGVTLKYRTDKDAAITVQHGVATLKKTAADEWLLFGALADVSA